MTKRTLKRLFFFLCILCTFLSAADISAQKKDHALLPPPDTSALAPRTPNAKNLAALRSSRDYRYDIDPTLPQNPIMLLIGKFLRGLNKLLTAKSYKNFWQYVLMVLMTIMVLYLLYKAKVFNFIFPEKLKKEKLAFASTQENIHEINFDAMLEHALHQNDYRLSIRMLYLKTLKLFADHHLIQWHPDRTNHSYLEELIDTPFYPDFKKMTYFFEWAWYGNFKVQEPEYTAMQDWAGGFSKQLRS